MRWFLLSLVLLLEGAAAKTEYRCVRWTWTGDVYNRKVVCLEWRKVERK